MFKGNIIKLMPWTGGWNIVTNPVVADPQQLRKAENIEYGYDGRRRKRGGSKRLNKIAVVP